MVQHSAQLRLEQDDQRKKTDGQELIQQKIQCMQLCHIRQPGNHQNHHDHTGNPHRACSAENRDDGIDHKRNQYDVKNVRNLRVDQV